MNRQNNNIPCWQCRYGAEPGHMEHCSCPQVQNISLLDLLPDREPPQIFNVGGIVGTARAKKISDEFNPAPFAVVSMAVGKGDCKYFEPMPEGSQRNN